MKTKKITNFIKKSSLLTFLILNLYSCKAQNIYNNERISYTLNNFEHCLFYSKQLSESEGVDLKKLNCSPYYLNKRDYSIESKKKLLEIIEKKYTNEYIRKISKKRILFGYKSELRKISEKLKDSSNFMYLNKFLKKRYSNMKKRQEKIQKILSNPKKDTIFEYKRHLNKLYESLKNYKLPDSFIYSIAFVEDKDKAIPLLNLLLKDTIHVNSYAVKIALAKLKINPFYVNQLNKLKDDINHIITIKEDKNNSKINIFNAYPRAGLLSSKEAVIIYSRILNAEYFDTIDHGDFSESSIPARSLNYILKLIDNNDFKKYFTDDGYLRSYLEYTEKDIKWAIEWFKKNGDKIIINDKHIPLLHNEL